MATVVLVYRIDVGSQDPGAMTTKVSNVVFNDGTVEGLGFDYVGAVTDVDAGKVRQTITLETNAMGDEMWPTAEAIKDATRNLFNQAYELGVPGLVTADEPVVS